MCCQYTLCCDCDEACNCDLRDYECFFVDTSSKVTLFSCAKNAAQAGVQLNKQANIDERKLKRDGKIQKKIAEMDRIEKEKIAKRRKKKRRSRKSKGRKF